MRARAVEACVEEMTMADMNERPILFSGPDVRAVLAGTKTVTRRIIPLAEFKPSDTPGYDWTWRGQAPVRSVTQQLRHPRGCWQDVRNDHLMRLCPCGVPGDRLWVRETWGHSWHHAQPKAFYRATDPDCDRYPDFDGWEPSTRMPRWASRLTLEVTSVRVERLQAITEEDARAEGVEPAVWLAPNGEAVGEPTYRVGFETLWHKINHRRASWASNPWVWRVAFSGVEVKR